MHVSVGEGRRVVGMASRAEYSGTRDLIRDNGRNGTGRKRYEWQS